MRILAQKVLEFWKRYRAEILIFLAVFGVRFAYSLVALFGFGQDAFISFSDAEVFMREASNLIQHGVMSQFTEPPYLPDPLRTPLYIWFLAALLSLGFSLFGIVTVQNILAGVVGVVVYRLGRILFDNGRLGSIAGVLFALEPGSVYWSNLLMSDNLFAALFIVSLYLFFTRRFFWFSAVFGLATLTRPVGLYVFPLFLFAVVLFSLPEQHTRLRDKILGVSWRSVGRRLFIMVLLFCAVISPWMIRNRALFGSFELSTAGWLNLYLFTVKEFSLRRTLSLPMPAIPDDYHPGEDRNVLYNYEFSASRFFKERTFSLVSKYPIEYPLFHLLSGIRGIHNHDYPYLQAQVVRPLLADFNETLGEWLVRIGQFFWWCVYAGALIGLFFSGQKRMIFFLLALIAFNAALIGYNGLISGGGRYTMPFTTLWFLLGGNGWMLLYRTHFKSGECAQLNESPSRNKPH